MVYVFMWLQTMGQNHSDTNILLAQFTVLSLLYSFTQVIYSGLNVYTKFLLTIFFKQLGIFCFV